MNFTSTVFTLLKSFPGRRQIATSLAVRCMKLQIALFHTKGSSRQRREYSCRKFFIMAFHILLLLPLITRFWKVLHSSFSEHCFLSCSLSLWSHLFSGALVRRTPAKESAWAPAWSSRAASSTPCPSRPTSAPSFANWTTTVSSGEHAGMEQSVIYSAATISMWVLLNST